ncbi:hypothetical protein GGR56DRAFT_182477 [Xylariaceae sp. FL0804]|nr:hypothetical protein GGR56DRAFT_182477 [Xylariaceae sp. FL0804]
MLVSWFRMLPLLGLLADVQGTGTRRSPGLVKRQQLMTCEQTYGPGFQICGSPDSGLCFSPSLGQSCCEGDSGYCPKGTYCAGVGGYCCPDGVDLQTCENAEFDLPSSLAVSGPSATLSTVPVPTKNLATGSCGTHRGSTAISNVTAPSVPAVASNKTVPPVVQVSVATQSGMSWKHIMMVAVASIFTAL